MNTLYHASNVEYQTGTYISKGYWKRLLDEFPQQGNLLVLLIELIFEGVRKEFCAKNNVACVSRFDCVFCFPTVEQAKSLAHRKWVAGHVYEVEFPDDAPTFLGDFDIITNRHQSINIIRKNAENYWKGERIANNLEVLVGADVKVVRKIAVV